MKQILLLLLLVPVIGFSQSKKKKRQAEEKANAELVANLKAHIQYLADDKLEGRLTGSKGEELAMQYIVARYKEIGLEPAGNNGFLQTFELHMGKQINAETHLLVDEKKLLLDSDYVPLAYSAMRSVKGTPAMALSEARQPWFSDLKDVLEENRNNPHFDIDVQIRNMATTVATKGATAFFIYNTSSVTDNVQFNKNDTGSSLSIPVIYITKKGFHKYFSDQSATISIDLAISFSPKIIKGNNIVGFINNHAANTVILGAHYDHLGYGGQAIGALDTAYAVHNGADDNASGTAALVELTRMLKKSAPAGNNYLVINFSGEELGLLGSKYWVDNPTISITPNYMINMDMVGRYDTAHKVTLGGFGTSPAWADVLAGTSTPLLYKVDSAGSGPSDHATFYRKDMPVLFFFTGSHSDYHKATDDWEKINYDGEKDIVKWVYQLIETTNTKGKLSFTKTRETQNGRRSFTVSLGVIPDYGFTGTGMRIDGVSPGKLAEKIGLKAGDILLQLGDFKFVDVNSYMVALKNFNKGDKTKLRIKRGNDEQVFDIEF